MLSSGKGKQASEILFAHFPFAQLCLRVDVAASPVARVSKSEGEEGIKMLARL